MDVVFMFAPISLTVAAFWLKNVLLSGCSTLAWLVLTGAAYFQQTGITDPYFYMFLFSAIMVIITPIAAFEIYHKAKIDNEDYTEDREYKKQERATPRYGMSAIDKLRIKHGMGASHISRRRENDRDSGW